MNKKIKATVVEKASDLLVIALQRAEEELRTIEDESTRRYEASKLVLQRIRSGEKGLHDPSNQGDKVILCLAAMDD